MIKIYESSLLQRILEIFEGQENVDNYDFVTVNGLSVDVKTGFRSIHTRLLVNVQPFNNLPKDYYVAVKLNAVDTDVEQKLKRLLMRC